MTKTLTKRIYLKSKLFTCKMDKGSSTREHISKFDWCISDLKDIDMRVEYKDQELLLLLSLSKSYENLVQTLILVGDSLTIDETRRSIIADDLQEIVTDDMVTASRNKDQV